MIKTAHCLFEQSGTFKNEFKKLGINAKDYDIQNEFGETDVVCDLFAEIEKAYNNEKSIFDDVGKDDLILAFFPCTRFECQIQLGFKGKLYQMRRWTDEKKLEYSRGLHQELSVLYDLICKLFLVSLRGGYRMIVENPANPPHYLTSYFPVDASLVDRDRTQNGDYFKKPTQYWFVNCKPKDNLVFKPIEYVEVGKIDGGAKIKVDKDIKTRRSMIHPQYAERFIKQHILEYEGNVVMED